MDERTQPVTLPEFPRGWFAIAFSRDLRRGDVLRVRFMGEDRVLFRTASGVPVLMDAYCPHLGAHMGFGGRVEHETLVCPFHGFRFGTDGTCVAIPAGTAPPPAARASVFQARETNGVILAFHGPESAAWVIPRLSQSGWSPLRTKRWHVRAHPQEVTENSVDLGHFAVVHGYEDVEVQEAPNVEGPVLRSRYAMVRPRSLFGRPVRFETAIEVHGLGYSTVDVTIAELDVRTRLFVLPTPSRDGQVNLRIASQLFGSPDPSRVHAAFAALPAALWRQILDRILFQRFQADVQQDFRIWRHKRFVKPPALAEGDAGIGLYRRWARQFYDE